MILYLVVFGAGVLVGALGMLGLGLCVAGGQNSNEEREP